MRSMSRLVSRLAFVCGYTICCASAQTLGESARAFEEASYNPPPISNRQLSGSAFKTVAAAAAQERGISPRDVTFKISYAERILVPKGSVLTVSVHDSAGRPIFSNSSEIKQSAPPYLVRVSLNDVPSYPLTLEANLRVSFRTSPSGQHEGGSGRNRRG